MKRAVAAVLLTGLLGCTTTSVKDTKVTPDRMPPSYDFIIQNRDSNLKELEALKSADGQQTWWKKYRQGLLNLDKNPELSCPQFTALAKETDFPLHELALLRAHQTCTDTQGLAPLNPEQYKNNYKWSQDVLAVVSLKQARKTDDKMDDIEALRESARQEVIPKKKEQYLLEALKIAEGLKSKADANADAEIQAVQAQLYRTSPRLKPHLTFKELPAAAMDHRQRREFEKALAIYHKILKTPQATADDKFQATKTHPPTHKIAPKNKRHKK